MNTLRLFLLVVCLAPSRVAANATLFLRILDQDGEPLPAADLYVYDLDHERSMVFGYRTDSSTFQLPSGSYRVYASVRRPEGDHLARLTSGEVRIDIQDGEQIHLIMPTRRYVSEDGSDPALLEKLGLAPDSLARL